MPMMESALAALDTSEQNAKSVQMDTIKDQMEVVKNVNVHLLDPKITPVMPMENVFVRTDSLQEPNVTNVLRSFSTFPTAKVSHFSYLV